MFLFNQNNDNSDRRRRNRPLLPPLFLLVALSTLQISPTTASLFGQKRKLGSPRFDAHHERFKAVKRDPAPAAATCSTGSLLCGPEFNGGCCPNDRACGLTDCPPASTAAAGAGGLLSVTCSESGYTACAVQFGGCCPSGYQCGRNDCTPPAGATITSNHCGLGSRLCPAEFNYGCCPNDRDCGISNCPPRTTSSFLYTVSFTTTDATGGLSTHIAVVTTAYIPTQATITSPPTQTSSVVLKAPAQSATSTAGANSPSSPSSGLSKGAIAGLVAGIAICVIAVFGASFLTLRRLNSASKSSERSETVVPTARSEAGDPDLGGLAVAQMSRRPGASGYSRSYYSGDGGGASYTPLSPSEAGELGSEAGRGAARNYSFDGSGRGHASPSGASEAGSWTVLTGIGNPHHERTVSDESVPSVSEGRVYHSPEEVGRRRRDTNMSQVSELDSTEVVPGDDRRASRDRASSGGAPGRPNFTSSRRTSGGVDEMRYAYGSSGERVRLADLPEVNGSGTFHQDEAGGFWTGGGAGAGAGAGGGGGGGVIYR